MRDPTIHHKAIACMNIKDPPIHIHPNRPAGSNVRASPVFTRLISFPLIGSSS
jgi:hypothetical protein